MDSPLANKQWERYTWTPGEEITDVKLNAIEQKLEELRGPAMNAIRYDIDQDLSEEAKEKLKKNLNISSAVGSHAMGEDDKNKAYIIGTTTAPVADGEVTATMVADPGVYLDTDSGSLTITGAFSRGRKENTIIGENSFAFGRDVKANGKYSHAEGTMTTASGFASHAEGGASTVIADYSHAEGTDTYARGLASHAEGYRTTARGDYSHAEGGTNIASGMWSHAEGVSHTEYKTIVLSGSGKTYTYQGTFPFDLNFHDKDRFCIRINDRNEVSVQDIDTQSKTITFSASLSNDNIQQQSFQLYTLTGIATGDGAHVEGGRSITYGSYAHAEGYYTNAAGPYSHTEGYHTKASGNTGHAEGNYTHASGLNSHAEGSGTIAAGRLSHAEGDASYAEGYSSHAEGSKAQAVGLVSHAEGKETKAIGDWSHAEGYHTIAASTCQHVFGQGNILEDGDQYLEIVGNGTKSNPHNARTLDWNGNEWLEGTLTANGRMLDVFIQGTQRNNDGKTAAWKGNAPFSALHDGQIIAYWLPVESADSNVTLELTLTNGMSPTTGAIPVYINGITRVKTHIPANNIVVMVYRENVSITNSNNVTSKYTGWWILRSQDTTTNTYDRTQYKMDVISAEAVPQATIGVFNGDHKLIKLAKNAAFDITKPILYVSAAYKADEKKITNYIQYGVSFDLTQTISSFPDSNFTGAAGDTVYIQGTLSGIMFTPLYIIAGTPSSSTAHTYILLGHLSTATKMCLPAEHPFFGFKNNVFTRI